MHVARSTTFRARPDAIDEGIAYIRDEVMPSLRAMDGCVGLSMICDRSTGRCIATSSWESTEAMRASNERLAPMRDRAGEILGGAPEVEEWEIAVMHRQHRSGDGACVRVTWMQMDPGRIDSGIDTFRMGVLPELEGIDGFCSANLFVDRETGRAVTDVCYRDRAALEASRERANELRGSAAAEIGADVLEVGEFELALAHLDVPELV